MSAPGAHEDDDSTQARTPAPTELGLPEGELPKGDLTEVALPVADAGGARSRGKAGRPDAPTVSLRHGLAILGLFSDERRWLRMGEIAEETGLSPIDAHMQVAAMRHMNLIQEGSERCYGLGSGPPDPMVAIRAMGIVRHTRAHLLALQRLSGCPVTLAMLGRAELVVVDRAGPSSQGRLEMTIDLYRRLPAHATALGKVLLAYLPEHREQELVAQMKLRMLTPFTLTDRPKLLRELQLVRDRALAFEDREHVPHRSCIAAPVRGAGQRVIAALGLAFTDPEEPIERLAERHVDSLRVATMRLSDALRHARVDDAEIDWPRF